VAVVGDPDVRVGTLRLIGNFDFGRGVLDGVGYELTGYELGIG
jgi:hypothetical protein